MGCGFNQRRAAAIRSFAKVILHGEQGAPALADQGGRGVRRQQEGAKKPKLTRLRSWLSMGRRVPHLPLAPDRPKVPSGPHPPYGKKCTASISVQSLRFPSLTRAIAVARKRKGPRRQGGSGVRDGDPAWRQGAQRLADRGGRAVHRWEEAAEAARKPRLSDDELVKRSAPQGACMRWDARRKANGYWVKGC